MPAPALLKEHVPLAPLLTLETGGPARFLAEVATEPELLDALKWARDSQLPFFVLGGGSNLVLSDAGFPGLVVQCKTRGITLAEQRADSQLFEVAAGEVWDSWVEQACRLGLAGIECLSGIPGSVGATPLQNVGAYGQEVAQVIDSVRVLDRSSFEVRVLSNPECDFAYRSSRFKHEDRDRYVVLSVRFRLSSLPAIAPKYPDLLANLPEEFDAEVTAHRDESARATRLLQIRNAVLFTRRQKSMVWDPADPNHRSCGSFFMNPIVSAAEFAAVCKRCGAVPPNYPEAGGRVKLAAAWLIERTGFARGTRVGAVGLSTKHTLSVVAHDGATSTELVRFARHVRDVVLARFGVELFPEPVFVGIDW